MRPVLLLAILALVASASPPAGAAPEGAITLRYTNVPHELPSCSDRNRCRDAYSSSALDDCNDAAKRVEGVCFYLDGSERVVNLRLVDDHLGPSAGHWALVYLDEHGHYSWTVCDEQSCPALKSSAGFCGQTSVDIVDDPTLGRPVALLVGPPGVYDQFHLGSGGRCWGPGLRSTGGSVTVEWNPSERLPDMPLRYGLRRETVAGEVGVEYQWARTRLTLHWAGTSAGAGTGDDGLPYVVLP